MRLLRSALLAVAALFAVTGAAFAACPAPGSGIVVNGTTATEAGCTITTGAGTPGAQANLAGTINLGTSTITTTGGGAYGAYANGTGSTVNLTDVAISTANANGVFVNSGTVEMLRGSIAAVGNSTNGVQVLGTGSQVTLTDVAISVSGTSGIGLFVQLGGHTVIMNGGSIATTANGARGVDVGLGAGAASSVTLDGVTLNVAQGAGAPSFGAVVARNGSTVDVTNSTIDTEVYGVHTIAGGARIDVTNTDINVTASAAVFGAYAQNSTTIALDHAAVTTTGGNNAHGLVVQDGSTITAVNNTTVSTSGSNAQGAFMIGFTAGNQLTITDTDIMTSGAGAAAVQTFANASITNIFSATDSTLSAANEDTIKIGGGIASIDFTRVVAHASTGHRLLLVDGTNPAAVTLTASRSTLSGDIEVITGNTAGVQLNDLTSYTGRALELTDMGIDATSIWNVTGSSTIADSLTNAGLINLVTNGASFKTLTVRGSYAGNNGTVSLNTVLGGDGSASDRLIFDGAAATGHTLVRIVNIGGPGTLTTNDGIRVVDAENGGTTAPNAFALAGPVVAGAYDYRLFQGGFDGTSDPDDWFLRSTEVILPPGQVPIAMPRPETSLYAAIPAVALTYGQALLDTLQHEEMDANEHAFGFSASDPDPFWNGSWARLIGQYGNRKGDALGIVTGRPEYDYAFGALQAGLDVYRRETPGGHRDNAGVYGAFGVTEAHVVHFTGVNAGTARSNAYTAGAYWTHYGPSGWYVDTVLQGTWFDIKATPNRALPGIETGGLGFAASIDGGYPIPLADGWLIEPQGQLVFQSIDLGDADEAIGTSIGFRDVRSLGGRVGARVARSWKDRDGELSRTAWIRPSVWHNFFGGASTLFTAGGTSVPFAATPARTWIEINAGFDAELSETASIYFDASYASDFRGGMNAISGKIGFKTRW